MGDRFLVVKERTFRRRYVAFLIVSDSEIPYKNLVAKIRELEIANFGARGVLVPVKYDGKVLIVRTPHKLKDTVIKMFKEIRTISGMDVTIYPLVTTSSIKNMKRKLNEMRIFIKNVLKRKS